MPPRKQKWDKESFFLLPFEETATCALVGPLKEPPATHKITEGDSSETNEKDFFQSCQVIRTSKELLQNGNVSNRHNGQFQIEIGQYVLLRPIDNSHRPSVGKTLSFWKGAKNTSFVLVQWCYRAEDLSECPREANGEDEVFETQHYDSVDIEAIAGRCSVTSYSDWISALTDAKRKAEAATKAEVIDLDAIEPEEQTQEHRKGEADEELSDTESCFWDNYSSASVYYYCKYFYDPIMHVFVASNFDDENAHPYDEIAALRGIDAVNLGCDDEEFKADDSVASSDDDGSMDVVSEGEEFSGKAEKSKNKPKRKRANGKTHRGPVRDKAQVASQFALPTNLGAPETLPCRDSEKEHVRRFLEDAIKGAAEDGQGGSRCLYISGVPGTGKTATVREIVRDLMARRVAGELAQFEVVEVNGMSLPDPNLVYTELYTAITGKRGVAPMHAAQLLEKRFAGVATEPIQKVQKRGGGGSSAREKGKCIILVLDEMDVLVSRKQKVLYDVLEWPTRKNARMAVIGIANTMDLPERMLPRLGSRLGVNRLSYPPYTSAQLGTILAMKIKEMPAVTFSQPALKLCAAKVGAVSGDVRRALELCRRASELVGEGEVVKPDHIIEALSDISGGARLKALTHLSLFERLFLVSAVCLAKTHGSFEVDETSTIGVVAAQALADAKKNSTLFKESGLPSVHELEEVCWRLAAQRMILIEKAAIYRNSRVVVNLSADDCAFGLRDCTLSNNILSGS